MERTRPSRRAVWSNNALHRNRLPRFSSLSLGFISRLLYFAAPSLLKMEIFGINPRLSVLPIAGHTNDRILPAPNNQPATIAKSHRRNRHQLALDVRKAIARICALRRFDPKKIPHPLPCTLANLFSQSTGDMLYQWLLGLRDRGRLCVASSGADGSSFFQRRRTTPKVRGAIRVTARAAIIT
jgi:hypothetical protein